MTEFKITYADWEQFKKDYYSGPMSERVGQAFCNKYKRTNPNLFYQKNALAAWEQILHEYVTGGDENGNTNGSSQ